MRIIGVTLIVSVFAIAAQAQKKITPLPMFQKNSLQVSALAGYSLANIYGRGEVPSYKGISYGAEVEYEITFDDLYFSPFLGYHLLDLNNSANSAAQSESISGSKLIYGLRIGSHRIFAKAALANARYEDQASGLINNSLQLKSSGFELGAGMILPVTKVLSVRISLDYTYFKFGTNESTLTQRLDMTSYTGSLGVVYVIPSG